jgi:hypothetical protein
VLKFYGLGLDGELKAEFTLPCNTVDDRYTVNMVVGDYLLSTQGLDGVPAVCYETSSKTSIVVFEGLAQIMQEVPASPIGPSLGCVYPAK